MKALALALALTLPVLAHAQSGPLRQNGPRIGVTVLTPGVVDRINDATRDGGTGDRIDPAFPVITQFGWQFELRTFQTEGGLTGVAEVVPLLSGLDRGLLVPSVTLISGIRSRSGVEFGVGPTLSVTPQESPRPSDPNAEREPINLEPRLGLAVVAGVNGRIDDVSVPLNLAAVFGEGGARLSLLVGLNTSSSRH